MKIVGPRVHSIAIADPPLRSSYGLHAPYALRNVLEIESGDGIVGIAETYGGGKPAQALRDAQERAVGANPYRLLGDLLPMAEWEGGELARSQTDHVPGENPLDASTRTYAVIETACLDLIGKAVDQPGLRPDRRAGAGRGAVFGLPILQACRPRRRGRRGKIWRGESRPSAHPKQR